MFANYYPKLYREYLDMVNALERTQPYLRRAHPQTVFAAASANFGQAATFEHTDFANKANGICTIFCCGYFDPKRSGLLVLRQLNLAIQFPPGSLILLPSALLKHANTALALGESRYSFTQFSAGGLFRWVQYGCQSWASLQAQSKKNNDRRAQDELDARSTAFIKASAAFSTIASLHDDRVKAGLLKPAVASK